MRSSGLDYQAQEAEMEPFERCVDGLPSCTYFDVRICVLETTSQRSLMVTRMSDHCVRINLL